MDLLDYVLLGLLVLLFALYAAAVRDLTAPRSPREKPFISIRI